MKLTQNELDFYNEKGYLIVEGLFTESEIGKLLKSTEKYRNLTSLPNVICETTGEIRSVFAPHETDEGFDWLYRQKRLVEPAEQLIGNQIYLYQFKLNNKKAFVGDMWEWHQDFPYWHLDDGVKSPSMVSAMVLFQDTTATQGALIIIPTSHLNGIADFEFKEQLQRFNLDNAEIDLMNSLNADLKYTVKKELLKAYAQKEKLVICEGKIGTCIFFHPNLFHASNSNLSPFDRNTAIVTYNDINNLPDDKGRIRPSYLCSRKFEIIKGDESELI